MRKLFSVLSSTLQGGVRGVLLLLALFANMSVIHASNTQVGGIWYDFNSSTEESVDFSAQGYVNLQEVSSYQGTHFSVTFDKGTNNIVPRYYNTGNAIRVYGGGYFIVTSESTITKIVVEFGSSDGSNAISTNAGTFSNGIWSGNSHSVKFTIGGTSGHRRIKKLIVTSSTKTASVTYRGSSYSSYEGEYSGSVVIPETVTYNGTIYSVTSIGDYAFLDCSSLTSVTIPNSVTSIGSWAFRGCSSLTSVTIPNSVKSIGVSAFLDCSSLTSVTIPNSVKSIGSSAFCGCSSLTSVTIGESVTSIGGSAFEYCSSLTSVTIPNSVTDIGRYAFRNCISLTSLIIGESVISIEDEAFSSCSGITSIRCEVATPPTIGYSTFYGISESIPVYVPCGCVKAYKAKSGWTNFTNIQEPLIEYSVEVDVNDTMMGTAKVDHNTFCQGTQISATPTIGYHFVQWNDGNTDNPRTLVLTQDTKLTAEFAISQYTITTRASHNERGTTQGDTTITYLEYITISATANYGYHFTQWSDGVTTNPRQVQVTEDKIYTADFEKNTYSISLSCNEEQGNVEGAKTAEYLDTVTISATPNIGYHFVQWNDGNTDNPRTLVLTQDTKLTAEFAISQYTINTRASHNERGTTQGDTTITYLEYITISATANYGYHFTQWSDGVTTNPRQVQVTEDKIYTADFEKNTYSISLFCNEEQGTVEGVTSAEYLDTVTISAKPNIGYHFVQWNDGNTDNPRSLVLTQDTKLTAEFALTLSGQCGDSLYWEFIEDTLHIIGTGVMYNYTSDTAPWKRLVSAIKALTIVEDVTIIGGSAFSGCSFLTSVTINSDAIVSKDYSYSSNISHIFGSQVTQYIIGDGVRGIGESAFSDCSSLTSVSIPNSVTSIGESAFSDCSSLTSVSIPNSVTSIGSWAFSGCSSLTSVTIPNSVTSIGSLAFHGCSSLTSVTIPNSVTSIGSWAFHGCSSLTSVTIPNSVKSIGEEAFSWCSSLTSITCEAENPPTVGSDAFYEVSKSIPVYVPCGCVGAYNAKSGWEDFTNIQEPLAEYSIEVDVNDNIMGTAKVDINSACGNQISATPNFGYHLVQWSDGNTDNPRSLVLTQDTILTAEFALTQSGQCGDNLYWELIDDTLHITGSGEMYDYNTYDYNTAPWKRSIKALCIGESVTSIGDDAFYSCTSLTSVTIPNSVTSIGSWAFRGCSSLTSVTIPNSVTSIGSWAFRYCSSLTSVTINSNAIVSTDYSYDDNISNIFGSQVAEYIIGDDVKGIGSSAFRGCSSLTSVTIGESVTSIGEEAFYGCSSLTSMTIPNSVTGIGSSAFRGCSSLTSVTIGESVTSIGEEAFYGCSSLTSMTIPNSVKSIGEEAFYGCSSLTSVTIGESVTSIGHYAFSSCSGLTSVTIPNSVTSIGGCAFEDCSSLTAIICEAATPPNLGSSSTSSGWYNPSSTFQGVSKSIPVYVPCGCVEAYNTASGWEDFTNFQEPLAYSIEMNVNDTIMGTAKVDYNTFCEGNQISATPNIGYHFVQWSDGNTDAIRTLELTQDTILTAEFAQSFSGQCGDNLYWSYDETAKTLSITGSGKMYDYTADAQPWLLFKKQLVEVTTSNTVTSIGTSAFEGCARLAKISLGTGLEDIAANAFAGCTRLYDIYVYATYPPFAEESSFANYNVYVYIPCEYQRDYILDVVWGKFKFIECLESEDVTTDGNVTIVPSYNDVTITWPTEDNADTYTIVIKKDGEVFCTLTFNADGQLLNIAFAPGRDGNRPAQYAEQAINGYRFTVTGLTEATRYAYSVTTKDAANQTIATYSGEFTTKGGTTTDMDNIQSPISNCQKILRNGQLIIIRNGVEYNAVGQEM